MVVKKRLVYRGRRRALLTSLRNQLDRLLALRDVNILSPVLSEADRAAANQLRASLAMKLTLKL